MCSKSHLRGEKITSYMPLLSIMVLTKDRAALLARSLASVGLQTYKDFEVIVVDDGSTDTTPAVIQQNGLAGCIRMIRHVTSLGIVASRQEALLMSVGKYVAILDDDDVWVDSNKLKKQVEYLDSHRDVVLVGSGIELEFPEGSQVGVGEKQVFRPAGDGDIRRTMLFRNNFFTSSVMFRRDAAIAAGGFVVDGVDVAEDYDLWLRLGLRGSLYNFPEIFVRYRKSLYTKARFQAFLGKQLRLIQSYRGRYPGLWLASVLLRTRLYLNF